MAARSLAPEARSREKRRGSRSRRRVPLGVCRGRRVVLAFVNDEKVVKKILEHLGDLVEPSREGKFLRYPSWLLSGTAPILLKGPLLLILCRDARRSRGVGGAAVPFAHIAYCRE